jgi:hypothetical protein
MKPPRHDKRMISMTDLDPGSMSAVHALMGYLPAEEKAARYVIMPPSTGLPGSVPPRVVETIPIHDCRAVARSIDIEQTGFVLRDMKAPEIDYRDASAVRAAYYPAIAELIRKTVGAEAVFVFDHNIRSVEGAAAGERGVRAPVADAHDDYTESSGPRRVREILTAEGRLDLAGHRAALINAWRPLRGPVRDWPLAVCDPRTVAPSEFIPAAIDHYADTDLTWPNHSGEIYSMHFSPRHRWFYVADQQPDEVLVFKCYDSLVSSGSRFTPHGGFQIPEPPPGYQPRISIEARAVVIYPDHG